MKSNDLLYINKIQKEFNLTKTHIHVKKFQTKITYEKLYNQLKEDEKIVRKLQEVLADKTGTDIYKAPCFTSKHNRQTAFNFINTLYGTDIEKPIHKSVAKRCRIILEFLGE